MPSLHYVDLLRDINNDLLFVPDITISSKLFVGKCISVLRIYSTEITHQLHIEIDYNSKMQFL